MKHIAIFFLLYRGVGPGRTGSWNDQSHPIKVAMRIKSRGK
jgi:hypothetical protein